MADIQHMVASAAERASLGNSNAGDVSQNVKKRISADTFRVLTLRVKAMRKFQTTPMITEIATAHVEERPLTGLTGDTFIFR